jgi:hypothetical protein
MQEKNETKTYKNLKNNLYKTISNKILKNLKKKFMKPKGERIYPL